MMEQITETNLYNNFLVLAGNQLRFNGHLLYDFEDKYRNVSTLSLEEQFQVFNQLVKQIYDTALTDELKAESVMILSLLFQSFSDSNASFSALGIGNYGMYGPYAQVMRLFGNDNKFYELRDLESFAGQYFSVILINYESVRGHEEAILSMSRRVVKNNGKIICFGTSVDDVERLSTFLAGDTSLYRLSDNRILICADNVRNGESASANTVRGQLIQMIKSISSNIYGQLQYLTAHHPSATEDWHKRIDELIRVANEMESIIASNYSLFENSDLKFQTNELKNALLDWKYVEYLNREHYEYIQSTLLDCYHVWSNGLY